MASKRQLVGRVNASLLFLLFLLEFRIAYQSKKSNRHFLLQEMSESEKYKND